jgi:hypothetical protein
MVGHSSERMREHYSSVSLEERREAAERVSAAVHAKDAERELNGSLNGSRTGVGAAAAGFRKDAERPDGRQAWAGTPMRRERGWARESDGSRSGAAACRWKNSRDRRTRKDLAASFTRDPGGDPGVTRKFDGSGSSR